MTEMTKSNRGGAGAPRTVETTPEGNVVSPHIGVLLRFIQDGIAEMANEYFRHAEQTDESGILRNLVAERGNAGPDDQSVYVRTTGLTKRGARRESMAVLRISDHRDKQKRTDVETRTLRVDDVITWTLKGVEKGRWEDLADRTVRVKHKSDPDVIFKLDANCASIKIHEGFGMIINMLNKVFEDSRINVNL